MTCTLSLQPLPSRPLHVGHQISMNPIAPQKSIKVFSVLWLKCKPSFTPASNKCTAMDKPCTHFRDLKKICIGSYSAPIYVAFQSVHNCNGIFWLNFFLKEEQLSNSLDQDTIDHLLSICIYIPYGLNHRLWIFFRIQFPFEFSEQNVI